MTIFTDNTMNDVLGGGSSDDDDYSDTSEGDDSSDGSAFSEEEDVSDDHNSEILTQPKRNATDGEVEIDVVISNWRRGVNSSSTLAEWARLYRGMVAWYENLSDARQSFVGPLNKPFRR